MEALLQRSERTRVSGDLPDFDSWVGARGPALLRLAYPLTGSRADAEDLVQEALSRALPRWGRIVRVEDPNAYVRRMVVNAHTSTWRRFGRREVPSSLQPEPDRAEPESRVGADDSRRLWLACRSSPAAQRTAVVLRFYEQLKYAEIAALTAVREGTVRSRDSRGIAALRAELGEPDG